MNLAKWTGVETSCSDVTGMRIVALFGAVLVGALGPLFWVAVIKKSDDWAENFRKAGCVAAYFHFPPCEMWVALWSFWNWRKRDMLGLESMPTTFVFQILSFSEGQGRVYRKTFAANV